MNKSKDDYFYDWESWFFGFGYGTGEELIIPLIKRFFECIPTRNSTDRAYDFRVIEEAIGSNETWLLINTMCHAEIIEYGTSPRCGWLTKEGYRLQSYLASKSINELFAIFDKDASYSVCHLDYCNCVDEECENPFWVSRRRRNRC